MKRYTTLYFDLDNTLLDFYKSEYHAIKALLKMHNLPDGDAQAKLYSDINLSYWERFERGEIKKDDIFEGRFITLIEKLGVKADTAQMAKDYFALLASGHDVMQGAEDILTWVKEKGYTVCATTNGIAFTQYKRIEESGLKEYFDYVFVSENAGHQKPEKQYFDYVLENSPEKDRSRILIIGDSQSSDILGGINSGIDTCWFNPHGAVGKYSSTYEITALDELKGILC